MRRLGQLAPNKPRGVPIATSVLRGYFKRNSSLLDQGLPKGGHSSTHMGVSRVTTRDDVTWVVLLWCVVCGVLVVCVCVRARVRSSALAGPAAAARARLLLPPYV